KVQPVGFGCWPWGDVLSYGWGPSGGYDQNLNDDSVRDAWRTIFAHSSIAMLDTAEHYGYTDGYSEKSIGRNWAFDTEEGKADRSKIVYATKYLPTPWRHPWKYPDIVLNAFRGSLERTALGDIDIYQIHGPSHFGVWPRLDTLLDSLAKAYELGHIKAIGTCNFGFEKVKYVYTRLKQRNVPLVSNQVEFSLLRQDPWSTGLIEKCLKLGIITIAYSPLAVGRLTGKYSSSKPPRGNRNFGDLAWAKIQPVVDELSRIGAKEGKTPSAVALNWVICKGAIPIPGVKNGVQVKDCLQAMGWRLSKEDEGRLDVLGLTNSWDW
ncbi:Aldo/keto reductase, partial [Saitoella complicata NRRL Y-17804]